VNAQIEQDADTILDRWLTDRLDFDVPCDFETLCNHAPADWIHRTKACNCSILVCDTHRALLLADIATRQWPTRCAFCNAAIAGPELIFFVPLREAPVS
jgi:hypothetical protein